MRAVGAQLNRSIGIELPLAVFIENRMTWFQQLTGLDEVDGEQVRRHLAVSGNQMSSAANGRQMQCGVLSTPSVGELQHRVGLVDGEDAISVAEVVGDVQRLHCDVANTNALFQVASQFNLLEMVAPSVTPEDGVGIYEDDLTQGPACAIACGAGTIYRNYFVPVNGRIGQTATHQIDCLADLGSALGNDQAKYWQMRNGYALATQSGLEQIASKLESMDQRQLHELRQTLRIGIQQETEVTLASTAHMVTQAYCSALPVAYSSVDTELWEPLARLVLEAAYEATLYAAMENRQRTGCNKVYLTLLGGGAFGNQPGWIFAAIGRALKLFSRTPLDVAIVSYGASKASVRDFVRTWASS